MQHSPPRVELLVPKNQRLDALIMNDGHFLVVFVILKLNHESILEAIERVLPQDHAAGQQRRETRHLPYVGSL